ncbi:hypothetical protein SCWH03_51520 [Streptomyces pacificus]|uniref:Uncharacterized protein n=1 Tax=Streptomyces pacificus TaxID=2705029 RepID=A0A6A0B0W9_9ACTN|nr:hypothetical protein SCWH03_51520 [Streptomyces pacificus]
MSGSESVGYGGGASARLGMGKCRWSMRRFRLSRGQVPGSAFHRLPGASGSGDAAAPRVFHHPGELLPGPSFYAVGVCFLIALLTAV